MKAALEQTCAEFADGAVELKVYQLKSVEVNNAIEEAIIAKMLVFEKVRYMYNDRQVRKKLSEIETVREIDGVMKIKQILRTGERIAKLDSQTMKYALDRELEINYTSKLSDFLTEQNITNSTQAIKL